MPSGNLGSEMEQTFSREKIVRVFGDHSQARMEKEVKPRCTFEKFASSSRPLRSP